MIEIYDTYTTRGSGVRSQILRSRSRIGMHVRFRTTDLPPSTSIRIFFIADYIEKIDQPSIGIFRPWTILSGDVSVGNGDYLAGIEWDLPDTNPHPSNIDSGGARRLAEEPWTMRSWAGTWEFKAVIGFLTPGVGEGQIAFSRENWVYNISY